MIAPKNPHHQVISNVDKVFSQQSEAGEMIAKTILDLVTNPKNALSIFAPETLHRAERISTWIDIIKRCIYTIIIILCAIRILAVIPEDMKKEINRRKFFDAQRQSDCYNEFVEIDCNVTTIPTLIKKCQQLQQCYEEPISSSKINIITFEWEIINDFFFFLSKKSAVFLGVVCGCFLYINLLK